MSLTELEGAPVVRLVLGAVVAASAFGLYTKAHIGLDADVLAGKRAWRLLVAGLGFQEGLYSLLLGASVLQSTKALERAWGSAKYAVWVLVVSVLATLLQLLLLAWGGTDGRWKYAASGPYGLVFGGLASMLLELPLTSPRLVLAFMSLSMVMEDPPASTLAAGCGLLAGCLWRIPFLPFNRLALPPALAWALGSGSTVRTQRLGGPVVRGSLGPPSAAALRSGAHQARPRQGATGHAAGDAFRADPEAVATLMALGFPEGAVVAALRRTNNNAQLASNLLLDA